MKFKSIVKLAAATMALLPVTMMSATMASAETRVTYKSAKSTSSYYQMAVQIAEGMKAGSNGDIMVTVEESQGSVQNVMEVIGRKGNYVFTTPPVLVKLARGGAAMFKDKANPRFDEIRAISDSVLDHAFCNVGKVRRDRFCRHGRQDYPAWQGVVRGA
jgi:TRAP-type uncharacterized transport system substrate-binding protein